MIEDIFSTQAKLNTQKTVLAGIRSEFFIMKCWNLGKLLICEATSSEWLIWKTQWESNDIFLGNEWCFDWWDFAGEFVKSCFIIDLQFIVDNATPLCYCKLKKINK